jgi:hypothetical protein
MLAALPSLPHPANGTVTPAPLDASQPLDLVISGGALRGYYMVGVADALKRCQGVQIGRLAGASAGAWCAVFIACGLSAVDWAETYTATQRLMADGTPLLDAYRRFRADLLPPDAHLRCSGRVFISITEVRGGLLHNTVVSEFHSREDVLAACIASSQLPFISTRGFGWRFRGSLVLDGGMTNNVPVFRGSPRPQLVVRLSRVPYPLSLALTPADPCIEALIVRGAVDAARLLSGSGPAAPSLEWVLPHALPHRDVTARDAAIVTAKWFMLLAVILPLYALHKLLAALSALVHAIVPLRLDIPQT